MDGARFDRFARNVAKGVSRRGMLAALGGLAPAGSQRAHASQLTPSTCGAAGDVCTMLMGCCDGLTCVTSAINTNYGVCVTGEGGTVSIGTTLISPFSENVEQEVAAMAAAETTSTTTTTTDPDAEREQQIAERKSRRSTRRNTRETRRSTNKNDQQDRREDRRFARDERRGPKLRLQLFNAGSPSDPVETVRVSNIDDESVVLTRIESLLDPNEGTSFPTPVVLGIGESFRFLSDNSGRSVEGQEGWNHNPICRDDTSDDGFVIVASFSADVETHEYTVSCDESEVGGGNGNSKRRKRKRNKNKNRNRNGG